MKKSYSFLKNSKFAMEGLNYLVREKSFIIELAFFPLLLIFLMCNGYSTVENIILFFSYMLILMLEGVNTTIETVVDLVTIEINPLAKKAKDIGSGIVLLSITNFLFILFYLITDKI